MNIYSVRRKDAIEYDQYDKFVVVAASTTKARNTHPESRENWNTNNWIDKSKVGTLEVIYIGRASVLYKETTVICASYLAG